ncbi:MAG: class I SAM-dependent methyltransferase [Phycisphaerales bacterium JB063]
MSRTHYPIPTRYELVDTPCWCGGEVFSPVASVDRFGQPLSTVMCRACGTLLLNPYLRASDAGRYYAEDYLQPGYNQGFAERFADRATEQRHLFPLADRLSPGSDVLDFGCGCGGVTNFLIERGHRVFGHDLSEEALAYAVGTGLLRHEPGGAARYDAVVTYHSVEHHVDPNETLGEMAALLKDGGLLCVAVPLINRIVAGAREDGIVGEIYFPHRWYLSVDNLDRLLARLGLVRVWSDFATTTIYQKTGKPRRRTPSTPARWRAKLRLKLINASPRLIKLKGMGRLLWMMRRIA